MSAFLCELYERLICPFFLRAKPLRRVTGTATPSTRFRQVGIHCQSMRQLIALAILWCAALSASHAHLMPAQRGTINLVCHGAYMVL
ncbi:hypothetical protein [Rhodoferax sp. PAMC 29310]|uniref:hypothetical protein n=1 Tax=Rhodoferax sp. PAMC 29310 TaxID=2822760 RepID=UPI001B32A4ED|nr:hypothetical protein [Rhodoferax sp. PAMC 29310]